MIEMIYHLEIIAQHLKIPETLILTRLLEEEKKNAVSADDLSRVLCSILCSMVLKNSNRQLTIDDLEKSIKYSIDQFNKGYTADRILFDLYERK